MRLILFHPETATRDCGHCQKFSYNEETGKVNLWRGEPVERPSNLPPPCRTKHGCPKGTPERPNVLWDRNVEAWIHYKECRAVGQFPDDPIVRRNARLIREVEDEAREVRQHDSRPD